MTQHEIGRFETVVGELDASKFTVELHVWSDEAVIENISVEVDGETLQASYSGFVFVSRDAALAEAMNTVRTLAGSDDTRTDIEGVKSIWGSPVQQ